jgi:transposase
MILSQGYKLVNINNLKLARYKEIFPAPAKTDPIDALAIVSFLSATPFLFECGKTPLQEVEILPVENQQLKRLSRRRRQLVNEKIRLANRMQVDLQSVCPGFMEVMKRIDQLFVLRFLSSRSDLRQLVRMKEETILKLPGIGKARAARLMNWQQQAVLGLETDWVGPMIIEDARRMLELIQQIETLERHMKDLVARSSLGSTIMALPGFGVVCAAEIAGEIGTAARFSSERSLAMYLGMAPLDNSSGKQKGTKTPLQINKRAKAAMIVAVGHHIRKVAESAAYYEKKRTEGKKHNQALRSLGRHLVRVLWKMIQAKRSYFISSDEKIA